MPERRQLRYESFDALRDDLHVLREHGAETAGQWSLAQICDHLTRYIRFTIEGFPFRLSWPLRLAGPWLLRGMLRRGRLPAGVRAPDPLRPIKAEALDDREAIDRLLATLDRYQGHNGPLAASPLFGQLDRATWDRLQLIHAAHHLSFAIPRGA